MMSQTTTRPAAGTSQAGLSAAAFIAAFCLSLLATATLPSVAIGATIVGVALLTAKVNSNPPELPGGKDMDPTTATTTSGATAKDGSQGIRPPAAKTGARQFWAAFILALIADAVLLPVVSNSWWALPGTLLINFVTVRTFVAYHPVDGPVVIYFGLNLLAATLFGRRGWPKVAAGVLTGTVVALLVDAALLMWVISNIRFV